MRAASIIALQHHERWNGEGYLGLKGQDIHLYARITAVADVFDALTSNRTYKDTWTVQEACGLILEKAGTQFDPAVSNAFAKCMDKIIKIRQSYPNRVIS
jgi:response regulator RpfG family c-di-GMP phosphodiesterase